MIDETDLSARFQSAFEVQPPSGAAQRLRSALLGDLDEPCVGGYAGAPRRKSQTTALPLGLRISLRLAAAALLVALAISMTFLFLAIHREMTNYVPVGPNSSPNHALAGGGGMVSPTVGWRSTAGGLLRTTDGGVHWTDVSPPSTSGGLGGYFLDATHAWLLPYRTADGGRTWRHVATPNLPSGSGGALFFHDANHGWLLSGTSQLDLLFATNDGGLHWVKLPLPSDAVSGCEAAVLRGGWVDRAVAFVSISDGWISHYCDGSGGLLLATHDGGLTWSPQQLQTVGTTPVAIDDEDAVIFDGRHLLITSDAGHSWAARQVPVDVDSVHFIDPMHGWASVTLATPNGLTPSLRGETVPLYRTDNGGDTWSRVPTNLQRDVTATYVDANGPQVSDNLINDVYFVDMNDGFAGRGGVFPIPNCFGPSKNSTSPPLQCDAVEQLLKTRDGGATWSVVGLLP